MNFTIVKKTFTLKIYLCYHFGLYLMILGYTYLTSLIYIYPHIYIYFNLQLYSLLLTAAAGELQEDASALCWSRALGSGIKAIIK